MSERRVRICKSRGLRCGSAAPSACPATWTRRTNHFHTTLATVFAANVVTSTRYHQLHPLRADACRISTIDRVTGKTKAHDTYTNHAHSREGHVCARRPLRAAASYILCAWMLAALQKAKATQGKKHAYITTRNRERRKLPPLRDTDSHILCTWMPAASLYNRRRYRNKRHKTLKHSAGEGTRYHLWGDVAGFHARCTHSHTSHSASSV
jgi:hypothetical protein